MIQRSVAPHRKPPPNRRLPKILAAILLTPITILASGPASGPVLAKDLLPPHAAPLRGLPAPTGEPAGLVLGVRQGESYRTLYLTHEDGRAGLAQERPYLVSPQRDGFWAIGAETATHGPGCPGDDCALSRTGLWVGRALPDRAAVRAGFERGLRAFAAENGNLPNLYYRARRRVEYVANGAVCTWSLLEGYSGGAHGFADDRHHCQSLPAAGGELADAPPIPLARIAPANRVAELSRQLEAVARRGWFEERALDPEDVQALGTLTVTEPLFRLHRDLGQVEMTAVGYFDAFYALSNTYRLTAAVPAGPAPPALTPYNPDLQTLLEALQHLDPRVEEVFLAPTNGVVFVISGPRLIGIDAASGREVLAMPLPHDQVVMADWATGPAVERWREAIGQFGF